MLINIQTRKIRHTNGFRDIIVHQVRLQAAPFGEGGLVGISEYYLTANTTFVYKFIS